LNYQKQENESLNEQLTLIVKSHEHIENENKRVQIILSDLDKVIKKLDHESGTSHKSIKNDLISILSQLGENHSYRNFEENQMNDSHMANNRSNSYITQNYERFKQQQDKSTSKPLESGK
jgi:hypothetical protein